MRRSLRRTLALRCAATIALGLTAASAVTYASVHSLLTPPAAGDLVIALGGIAFLGSGAALVGAWWLAGSVVRPVHEITEQATRVEAGTLDQRISAHADAAEYQGLVAVLNRMLERLERGFQAQRRLTADVSHELRSPLTALRGEIEVALRAERTPRDYQRVLHSALEEIERLTEMSDELLLITRAEGHLLRIEREATDVNAIADRALAALRGRIEERGLSIERCFASGGVTAVVDRDLIERVVHQLLDNAVKFTPAHGTIRVTTAAPNGTGRARLSVEDSGPGITPEHLARIFEPFYQVDEARSRGTGTGLGLAMAAAIVRLHGGSIRAGNAPGGGARFEVDLPVA